MNKYHTKMGGFINKEDEQIVGKFLFEECSGKETKEILKLIKQKKSHPIHKYIVWNNDKAGELYRLYQLRNIINHFEIEIISEDNNVRNIKLMYNVSDDDRNIYVNYDDLLNNVKYIKQIIEEARLELLEWTKKYKDYQQLLYIRNKIRNIAEYEFKKIKIKKVDKK